METRNYIQPQIRVHGCHYSHCRACWRQKKYPNTGCRMFQWRGNQRLQNVARKYVERNERKTRVNIVVHTVVLWRHQEIMAQVNLKRLTQSLERFVETHAKIFHEFLSIFVFSYSQKQFSMHFGDMGFLQQTVFQVYCHHIQVIEISF